MEDFLLESPICLATPKGLSTHKNYFTGCHTTIDLTFASPNLATKTAVAIPDNPMLFSDHSLINIYIEGHNISSYSAQLNSASTPHFRLKETNWLEYREQLENISIQVLVEAETLIDEKVCVFQSSILTAVKKAIPLKGSY